MSKYLSAMLVLALSGCACTSQSNPEPQKPIDTKPTEKPTEKTVSVATWNVHNFFNTVCDSGACGGTNYEPSVTQAYYDKKLSNVVNGVWKLDVDVVLLQEIETEGCMQDLQASLGKSIYPSAIFGEIGRAASVDVAILTRGTVTDVKTHRAEHWIAQTDGSEKQLSRELLQVEITLPNGIELTAFTTHFVSKATDSVGDRRLGEAVLTQQILAQYIAEHPNRLIVFGGDLNDTPDSAPIQALNKDGVLLSATAGMPPEQITTWGNSAAFDHIYYASAFSQQLKGAEIVCDENRANGYSSSDHCAVKTLFSFPPETAE